MSAVEFLNFCAKIVSKYVSVIFYMAQLFLIQFLFKNLVTWLYLPMSPPIILLMRCVMWTGGGLANGNKGRYERERHVPGQLHAAHMSRKRIASYTPRYSSPPHLSHPHEFRLNSPIVLNLLTVNSVKWPLVHWAK